MRPTHIFSFLILGLSIFSYSHIFCQSASWTLVYENDANGQTVHGSLDNLIQAIRAGEEVRIGWSGGRPNDELVKVEHFADAKFLTIMSGKTVQAQIDPIIGQTPDFENQQITFKQNLSWCMIASSNGKADHMMRNVDTGVIVNHQIRQRGFKWFVRK